MAHAEVGRRRLGRCAAAGCARPGRRLRRRRRLTGVERGRPRASRRARARHRRRRVGGFAWPQYRRSAARGGRGERQALQAPAVGAIELGRERLDLGVCTAPCRPARRRAMSQPSGSIARQALAPGRLRRPGRPRARVDAGDQVAVTGAQAGAMPRPEQLAQQIGPDVRVGRSTGRRRRLGSRVGRRRAVRSGAGAARAPRRRCAVVVGFVGLARRRRRGLRLRGGTGASTSTGVIAPMSRM